MKTAVMSVVVGLVVFLVAVLLVRNYEQHQHMNFVTKEAQELRQELCSMEPSKREQFCANFIKQIDESTIACSSLGSGLDGDEYPISTSIDWDRHESSDVVSSYLHCN